MRATGWHNGKEPGEADGYGIRLNAADRDKYFVNDWEEVVLELDGGDDVTVTLSPSFWRSCSELRSADVGRWLLADGVAPWSSGSPPPIAVRPIKGNRFSARVLRYKSLL